MITALSNTSSISEEMEQLDHDDLESAVSDVVDSTEEITDVAEDTVDEDLDETTDTMVMDRD